MNRTLGADISHWQVNVDFDKMVSRGVQFVMIKVSERDDWVDSRHAQFFAQSETTPLLRGGYHFFRKWHDAKAQARHFWTQVEKLNLGRSLDFPPILDVEELATPASRIKMCYDELERLSGREPILYSRKNIWDSITGDMTWAAKKTKWVAQYPYRDWHKSFNGDIEAHNAWVAAYFNPAVWGDGKWTFWQITDSAPGAYYGVESGGVDLNLFNGDREALLAWSVGVPIDPPDPQPIMRFARTVRGPMIVRTEPRYAWTTYTIRLSYTRIDADEIVEVLEVHPEGNNVWIRVGYKQWIAFRYNGEYYCEWA